MGNLCRHAFAAVACLLFVFLWLTAGNQDALSPWVAALTQAAACALRQTACEGQPRGNAGVAAGAAVTATVPRPAAHPTAERRPGGGS
jgi:hypothetical protein